MPDKSPSTADVAKVQELAAALVDNVSRVLVGKREAIEDTLVALLCGGHILIEDVPGVGKTMLARSLARSLGPSFRRIQFTADLLPSDITGVTVYDQRTQSFSFKPGPIFSQVVLADEINRGTPRTQAALLECMEELQVTVDGVQHAIEQPFLVIATQNPVEFEGTFPLPEAQLDRFFARVSIGYPDPESEIEMLDRLKGEHPIERIEQVVSTERLLEAQRIVREVRVSRAVREYIVEIVRKTREHAEALLGVSPRGSLALYRATQSRAALSGRAFAIPDDVKRMAVPVLAHRIVIKAQAGLRGATARKVVADTLDSVPVDLGAGLDGAAASG